MEQTFSEVISSIPWGIVAPLLVIQSILLIVALVDWFRIESTNGPKWVWLIIILFFNIPGPILYFLIGRRNDG
ncbi:PLD nuclease N-terminal domain-containing protein [Pontibacillus salipaludis]|uniref:Negative regulatory protein YxlE n=1 Tax=Pontibacillus salipaludis TaxID=1697394 RepID=A0ABQ1Q9J0_9BACI|nr:PLD nuclease N-terminal domain-containing protein [Pontibacillus salipaludis]GGD20194.1 negative regulatory protein YxlE [Pontibacillus salipaludis]